MMDSKQLEIVKKEPKRRCLHGPSSSSLLSVTAAAN